MYKVLLVFKYELQILSDGMTEKEEHENGTYHKRRSL